MAKRNSLQILFSCLTSPKHYLELIHLPWIHSLLFFIGCFFVFGLAEAHFFKSYYLDTMMAKVRPDLEQLVKYYPQDLELKISEEGIEASPSYPLIQLPYPQIIQEEKTDSWPKNFISFINQPSFNPNKAEHPDQIAAIIVLSQKQIWLKQNSVGEWREYPISLLTQTDEDTDENTDSVQYLVVDSTSIKQITQNIEKFISKVIVWLSKLVYYVFPPGLIICYLWFSSFNSVILYLISRLNNWTKKTFTFKSIWQITAQLFVLAEMVNLIARYVYQDLTLPMFDYTYLAGLVLVVLEFRAQANKTK